MTHNFFSFQIMTSIDQYAKQYLTKRRTTPQHDTYHLIIFPSDNSFSVVKSKHCTAAEHNGIVMVQSGGKKYSGFIVQTGQIQKYFRMISADLFFFKFRFFGYMQ